MPDEPSAGLLSTWRDRIVELKAQIDVVEDEIRGIEVEGQQLEAKKAEFEVTCKRERRELYKQLDSTNAKAEELEKAATVQMQRKEELQAEHARVLNNYDQLREDVKAVIAKEKALEARTDYDHMLQKESAEWAEEEHQLRTAYNSLLFAQKEARAKQQADLAAAEAALRDAEGRLHSDRMSRDPIAARHRSRQPSLVPPPPAPVPSSASVPRLGDGGSFRKSESRKRDYFGDLTNQNI